MNGPHLHAVGSPSGTARGDGGGRPDDSAASAPPIRPARPEDLPAVIAVLAAALDDTDIARWLVPDRAERVQVYRRYFALITPWFFDHGTVDVTDDRSAATLWARLDGKFTPDIANYDEQLAHACGTATPRFVQLDLDMHAAHPDGITHDYLAFVGVAPHRQGQGIGSRLLRTHHRRADRDQVPAYLEATGRRNAALYARNGYIEAEPFHIGDGPELYPMLRQPQ